MPRATIAEASGQGADIGLDPRPPASRRAREAQVPTRWTRWVGGTLSPDTSRWAKPGPPTLPAPAGCGSPDLAAFAPRPTWGHPFPLLPSTSASPQTARGTVPRRRVPGARGSKSCAQVPSAASPSRGDLAPPRCPAHRGAERAHRPAAPRARSEHRGPRAAGERRAQTHSSRSPSGARLSRKVTQRSATAAFAETQNKIRTELLMPEEFPIRQLLQEAFFHTEKVTFMSHVLVVAILPSPNRRAAGPFSPSRPDYSLAPLLHAQPDPSAWAAGTDPSLHLRRARRVDDEQRHLAGGRPCPG